MRFWTRLAVVYYVTTILMVGTFLVVFVLNWIDFHSVVALLSLIYTDSKMRLIFGIIGGALLFKNFIFAQVITENQQREKTIAFDNPAGRVSVSLIAMEDLVRRVMLRVPEVKEVKPNIVASKKGALSVGIRLTLKSDVNIPETTAALQEMVKRKIQETIGIEENVVVRIDVIRISGEEVRARRSKGDEDNDDLSRPRPIIPFQGYRP